MTCDESDLPVPRTVGVHSPSASLRCCIHQVFQITSNVSSRSPQVDEQVVDQLRSKLREPCVAALGENEGRELSSDHAARYRIHVNRSKDAFDLGNTAADKSMSYKTSALINLFVKVLSQTMKRLNSYDFLRNRA
ncbi:hypothetical protein AC579_1920 [Pseudocercospora musae]|uniref:Uncharacterized protein n=1 Tax=Pseudocercospora musae TaxID=113226 RepID=A0A139HFI2_9PEZI|nr:hypothetical protein AC579_1920 [Pseudocercospora musae]